MKNNSLMGRILSPLNEKKFRDDLSAITNTLSVGGHDIVSVEKVLYDNNLMKLSRENPGYIRTDILLGWLEDFIVRNSNSASVCHVVQQIYFHYLGKKYADRYVVFSDEEIDLVKEITWMTYYVGTRNIPLVYNWGSIKEIAKFLLNADDEYVKSIGRTYPQILRAYTANAISLKDGRVTLFPYPDCCDLNDMVELITKNFPEKMVLCTLAKEIQSHQTNRGHYANFIAEQLRESIKE